MVNKEDYDNLYRMLPNRKYPVVSVHMLHPVVYGRPNCGQDAAVKKTYFGGFHRYVMSPQSLKSAALRNNPFFNDAFDTNEHLASLIVLDDQGYSDLIDGLKKSGFEKDKIDGMNDLRLRLKSLSAEDQEYLASVNIFGSSKDKNSEEDKNDKKEYNKGKSAPFCLTLTEMNKIVDFILEEKSRGVFFKGDDKEKIRKKIFDIIFFNKGNSKRVAMNGSTLFSCPQISTESAISFSPAFSVNRIKKVEDFHVRKGDYSSDPSSGAIHFDYRDISSGLFLLHFDLDMDRYGLNLLDPLLDGQEEVINVYKDGKDSIVNDCVEYLFNSLLATWGAGHGSLNNKSFPIFACIKIFPDADNTYYSGLFDSCIESDLAKNSFEILLDANESLRPNTTKNIYCVFNGGTSPYIKDALNNRDNAKALFVDKDSKDLFSKTVKSEILSIMEEMENRHARSRS